MITIKCKSKVAEQMLVNELMKNKNLEVALEENTLNFVTEDTRTAIWDMSKKAPEEMKDMVKKGVGYDKDIRDLVHKVAKHAANGEYDTVKDHAKALSDVAGEAHKNAKGLRNGGWAFPHWKKLPAPTVTQQEAKPSPAVK